MARIPIKQNKRCVTGVWCYNCSENHVQYQYAAVKVGMWWFLDLLQIRDLKTKKQIYQSKESKYVYRKKTGKLSKK